MKNPLFLFAVTLIFALLFCLGGGLFLSVLGFLFFFMAAAIRIAIKRKTKYTIPMLSVFLGIAFAFALSLIFYFGTVDRMDYFQDRECKIEGTVIDFPAKTDYGYQYTVEVSKLSSEEYFYKRKTKAILYSTEELPLSELDTFRANADYMGISKSEYKQAVDYEKINLSKGIIFRASTSVDRIEKTGNAEKRKPFTALSLKFAKFTKENYLNTLGEEYGNFLYGLVSGRKNNLSIGIYEALQRVSLSHILSVSGMHMSFLVAFLLFLLKKCGKFPKALVIGSALIFYCFIANFSPSVVRSAIMSMMLLLGSLFGKEYDSYAALSFSAVVILLQNPFAVYDLGFQLSFSCVLGIVVFSSKITNFMLEPFKSSNKRFAKGKRFLVSSIAISLSALTFSSIILLFQGKNIYLLSPIVNLLCLWTMPLLFIGGIFLGLLGGVPLFAGILSPILYGLSFYVVMLATKFSKLTFFIVSARNSAVLFWIIYVALIFGFYLLFQKINKRSPKNGMRKIIVAAVCTFLFVQVFRFYFPTSLPKGITVDFIDVGQGECILIETENKNVLIDCGSASSGLNADELLENYMHKNSIGSLDIAVLSHLHADHADDMAGAIMKTGVKKVILPPEDGQSNRYEEDILLAADKVNADVLYAEKDLRILLAPEVYLYVYSGHIERASNENEQNLVMLLSYSESEFLFMGDLDRSSEDRFAEYIRARSKDYDIDVLQVGHHGSKYASREELLETTTPQLAIISVGKGNTYGHPTKEALERLSKSGAKVYTTMEEGTISLSTSGDGRYELRVAGGN